MNAMLNSSRTKVHELGSAMGARTGRGHGEESSPWWGLTKAAIALRDIIEPPSRRAAEPPSRRAAEPPSRRAAEPPSRPICVFMQSARTPSLSI